MMPLPLDTFLQQIKQIKIITYKQTNCYFTERQRLKVLTYCVTME